MTLLMTDGLIVIVLSLWIKASAKCKLFLNSFLRHSHMNNEHKLLWLHIFGCQSAPLSLHTYAYGVPEGSNGETTNGI